MAVVVGTAILYQDLYSGSENIANFIDEESEENEFSTMENSTSFNFTSRKQIEDNDTISIPLTYEDAIKYNMLTMKCTFFSNEEPIRAFYDITNYNYRNANTTDITIKLNAFLTFRWKIKSISGTLDRCHVPNCLSVADADTSSLEKHTIINPDLYFVEHEVSNDMKITKKYSPKLKDEVGMYFCMIFVKPQIFTKTPNDANSKQYLYRDENNNDTMIRSYDPDDYLQDYKNVITVNRLYLGKDNELNYSLGKNKTPIVCLAIKFRDNINYNANGNIVSNANINDFLNTFSLLGDRIIATFILPTLNNASNLKVGTWEKNLKWDDSDGGHEVKIEFADIYRISNINDLMLKVLTDTELPKEINFDSDFYNTDSYKVSNGARLNARNKYSEKKMLLYPYSYNQIKYYNATISQKYQDLYKILTTQWEERVNGIFALINPLEDSTGISLNNLFDFDSLVDLSKSTIVNLCANNGRLESIYRYYNDLQPALKSLPNFAMYLSQYETYLNYKKALVDNQKSSVIFNAVVGGISDIASVGVGVLGVNYSGNTSAGEFGKYLKYQGIGNIAEGGLGLVSTIGNAIYKSQELAIQESNAKKQPPSVIGKTSGTNVFYTDIYDATYSWSDYVLKPLSYYHYELNNRSYEMYFNLFYLYGVSIPLSITIDQNKFNNILNHRNQFVYIKFANCSIDGDIPYKYRIEMQYLLQQGLRFMRYEYENRRIPPKEHGENLILFDYNNSVIGDYTEPFFVKEWRYDEYMAKGE